MSIKINTNNNISSKDLTKIKITIPTNVYFLVGIRDFTLDTMQNIAGLDSKWAHRFQTIVDELTNNAIEHGSKIGEMIEIEFQIQKNDFITITVSDSGTGSEKITARELQEKIITLKNYSGKPRLDLRNRGFQIITSWVDKILFTQNERGGVSVAIQKSYSNIQELTEPIFRNSAKNVLVLEV
jgi:anti-sigma regulatory factor (Ser/Thr protein kinase)